MTQINIFMKQKQTHRQKNRLGVARRRCSWVREELGTGIRMGKQIRSYCIAQGTIFTVVIKCNGKENIKN